MTGELNLGTGHETTVLELVEILGELGGRDDFMPQMAEGHAGDIPRMSLDSSPGEEALGWSARYLSARGLERTLAGWRARSGS